MRPTLRQLEYLCAVADALNFREAARRCHVTQPALSTQIAQLEDALGAQLFERDRRRVIATPAGLEMTHRARAILAGVDEMLESAHALGAPLSGELRLGVIPTIAPYALPAALPALRQAFPELRVLLREEQTERLLALLAEGHVDLLLLALEADLGDVEKRALFRDHFFVAAGAAHHFAERASVREQDLNGETVLLLDDGHCLRAQAWSVCEQSGAQQSTDFRATSLGTLAQMARAGAGITLLPALALADETHSTDLVIRPFEKPAPYRTIGLAWRKSSPRQAEYNILGDTLKQTLEVNLTGSAKSP